MVVGLLPCFSGYIGAWCSSAPSSLRIRRPNSTLNAKAQCPGKAIARILHHASGSLLFQRIQSTITLPARLRVEIYARELCVLKSEARRDHQRIEQAGDLDSPGTSDFAERVAEPGAFTPFRAAPGYPDTQ